MVGKTNVGKTLFALRFAAMLGQQEAVVTFRPANGPDVNLRIPLAKGETTLTGETPHLTRCLQSLELTLPKGKGRRSLTLVDTCGLIEGIHPNEEIRQAMAQTLAAIRQAEVVLHMVDITQTCQPGSASCLGPVDYQVAQFAGLRPGYALLANKMDLPGAQEKLKKLRTEFTDYVIIALSVLRGQGMKEVKQFVWRHL